MSVSLSAKRETILVVDDNPPVLGLVVAILECSKFHVLWARNGAQAIELANETAGTIDLLLSDADMPQMSGPDLGETLQKARPDMHVILMAGRASGSLRVPSCGWTLIQKPFVPAKLIQVVASVLHPPERSQSGGHRYDGRKALADAPSSRSLGSLS